jgi:hypothetical protein
MILKCLYSFIRGRNKFEMTSKLKFYVEQSTNATLHDKHDHQYGRNIKSLKIRCCFVVVFYCIYWDVCHFKNTFQIKQATFAEYSCPIRLRGPGRYI